MKITVVDYDRIGENEPIGKVTLGLMSESPCLRHWNEMIESPLRPICYWHPLRDVTEDD